MFISSLICSVVIQAGEEYCALLFRCETGLYPEYSPGFLQAGVHVLKKCYKLNNLIIFGPLLIKLIPTKRRKAICPVCNFLHIGRETNHRSRKQFLKTLNDKF